MEQDSAATALSQEEQEAMAIDDGSYASDGPNWLLIGGGLAAAGGAFYAYKKGYFKKLGIGKTKTVKKVANGRRRNRRGRRNGRR
jgi:hypothetical protein